MDYTTSGRVFEVFKMFCESTWFDWVQARVSTDQANREIDQKRRDLESRWHIKLAPYVIGQD